MLPDVVMNQVELGLFYPFEQFSTAKIQILQQGIYRPRQALKKVRAQQQLRNQYQPAHGKSGSFRDFALHCSIQSSTACFTKAIRLLSVSFDIPTSIASSFLAIFRRRPSSTTKYLINSM